MTMHILYGMPGAYYTAKVRAYLRKQRIPFEERVPGDARFTKEIVPQTERWIIPVLQTPDGQVIQDGTVILDHFEALGSTGPSATPPDPLLRVLAHVFELFGGEGMLRPAMHYRWNFDAHNLPFLRADFIAGLNPNGSPEEAEQTFLLASGRMRKATLSFGVNPETIPLVEASYLDFLQRFERHLVHSPYVLGSTPTYADYGLIAPLQPHLARDPYPGKLMKQVAPRVLRWVERMNAPDAEAGEYLGLAPDWIDPLAADSSLHSLLRFIAEDYLPELRAQVEFSNAWLADQPDLQAGTNGLPRTGDRSIGKTTFTWRGVATTVTVLPYRLYMLQRIQDAAAQLNATQSQDFHALMELCGLRELLTLRSSRRVERRGQCEVWGA